MALQALLFCKNPETVEALTAILAEAGIRPEICADIFGAIEKGTKQPFPCVIADWADQPEAGFLVKRARESEPNSSIIPIAIVDTESAAKSAREGQIEFVLFRPIVADEVRAVLAKARKKMIIPLGTSVNLRAALAASEFPVTEAPSESGGDPDLLTFADHVRRSSQHHYEAPAEPEEPMIEDDPGFQEEEPAAEEEMIVEAGSRGSIGPLMRKAFAAALLVFAGFSLWRGHDSFLYLVRTPEGGLHVLKHSVAALFFKNGSGAQPVGSAGTEAQQDAYFSRNSNNTAAPAADVEVVNGEITIPDAARSLPKAFDLPLPSAEFAPVVVPPPARVYAKVPDSLKNSLPIGPPVVATVNPATQLLPVSVPAPPVSQVNEPLDLTEQNARALAIRTVDAVYPPEAMAQKLHGPVVLQAVIGHDGTVQDVKIVRGYFLLGRAAVAAVKQWRFKPYTFNGQPVSVRTQITLNFSYPPA